MNPVDRFAVEVRRFRKWLYCGIHKNERAVREALLHVTSVVAAAVDLPPVFASLNDDFWGLDGDLSRGLVEYNAGKRVRATWLWEVGFRLHWGRHATGAIEALRSWLDVHSKD